MSNLINKLKRCSQSSPLLGLGLLNIETKTSDQEKVVQYEAKLALFKTKINKIISLFCLQPYAWELRMVPQYHDPSKSAQLYHHTAIFLNLIYSGWTGRLCWTIWEAVRLYRSSQLDYLEGRSAGQVVLAGISGRPSSRTGRFSWTICEAVQPY